MIADCDGVGANMEGFFTFLLWSVFLWLGVEAIFAHQEQVLGLYVFFGTSAIFVLIHKIRHPK